MSEGLTTSKLPPIPEHKAAKPEPAITSNKTQPVWPVLLGAERKRFTGEGMITTGNIEQIRAAQAEAAKKNGKGK